MTLLTINAFDRCSVSWNGLLWRSVDTSSQIPLRDDDVLKIEFMFLNETQHAFTPDRDTQDQIKTKRDTQETYWVIPHTTTTKAITVRPSELYNHDSTSIMQSSSGRMIVNFINAHFPPRDKLDLPKVVADILYLVQNSIPLVPNDFIHVRRFTGIEIMHHRDDEVTRVDLHNRFEATKLGTCAICLDDFEVGRNTSRLPCLHVFHGPCIVKWLEIDPHCPLCRCSLAPELAPWFNA